MENMEGDMITISRRLLEDAVKTTKQLKSDTEQISGVIKEELNEIEKLKRDAEQWRNMQSKLESGSHVLVNRTDIERLITEAMQIKEYLPKVLKKDYYTAYARLDKVESDASKLKAEKTKLSGELDRMTKKYKTTLGDLEHERQEKAELKHNVEELNEINAQQSDYCSRMGSASCTLLWRLSQRDDCMETLVAGTQTEEFIQLVCHTVESFALTLSDGEAHDYEDSSGEVKFVLALCGVATNIAASPYGREFLMTNSSGKMLVNSVLNTICQLPPKRKQEMKIRNLCLKFLYNISINQQGIKFLSKKSSLIQTLTAIIEVDVNLENRVLSVRLIQSLMLESDNESICYEVAKLLPIDKMRNIAVNANGELQEALLELINDIKFFQREQ